MPGAPSMVIGGQLDGLREVEQCLVWLVQGQVPFASLVPFRRTRGRLFHHLFLDQCGLSRPGSSTHVGNL